MRVSRDGYSIESGIAKGRALPDWYLDEPYIFPHEQFYIDAFANLTSCRQVGMGLGPIPWTAIRPYADDAEFDDEMRGAFVKIIQIMDAAFLEWHEKSKPKTSGQNQVGNRTVARR